MSDGRRFPTRLAIGAIVGIVVVGGASFGGYLALRKPATKVRAAKAETAQKWTCPMHPQIIRDKPGECPICGMDLVPVVEKKKEAGEKMDMGIEGHGVVEIDSARQQLFGVKTTTVERRPLDRVIRTTGRVTIDESLLSDIQAKISGWIERLYADETGKIVRRGQPLLTIYSPELVSTQREYLVALRSRERLAKSPFPEVRRSGETLVESARERLLLWDIPQKDIERLEKTGQVKKALTLYAPATGYIMDKMAVAGMRVTPEMRLFRLADLSHVWVDADIYESEVPTVQQGLKATLTLASYPGQKFHGRITYVYPTVEAATRSVKARIEFPNPGLKLKPDMYGDVELTAPGSDDLAIPEEAVVDTGLRKVVFLADGNGKFTPREVTLGPRMNGYYPVLTGLEGGEQVVSSPNFLIDSESRFEAAKQAMTGGSGGHAGHGQ